MVREVSDMIHLMLPTRIACRAPHVLQEPDRVSTIRHAYDAKGPANTGKVKVSVLKNEREAGVGK